MPGRGIQPGRARAFFYALKRFRADEQVDGTRAVRVRAFRNRSGGAVGRAPDERLMYGLGGGERREAGDYEGKCVKK